MPHQTKCSHFVGVNKKLLRLIHTYGLALGQKITITRYAVHAWHKFCPNFIKLKK